MAKHNIGLDNENYQIKQEIRHKVNKNGIEMQTWSSGYLTDKMSEISKQYIDLRDKIVKESLLCLGWTPPTVHPSEREMYMLNEMSQMRLENDVLKATLEKQSNELHSFKEKLREFLKEEDIE